MIRNSSPARFLRSSQNDGVVIGGIIFRMLFLTGVLTALLLNMSSAVAQTFGPGQQSAVQGCTTQADVVTLSPGKPVQRGLKSGEQNCFRISLDAGQLVHIVVTPHDLDVAVALVGPDEQKLAEVSSLDNIEGDAILIRVAAKSGAYRIEIRPADVDVKPGSYVVQVAELRAGTPRDEKLVAAEDTLTAGHQALGAGRPELLPTAYEKYDEALSRFRELGEDGRASLALRRKANVLVLQGELPKAMPLFEEALQLVEQKYGKEHVKVVPALWDLAEAQARSGDLPKARATHERAQRIMEGSAVADSFTEASGLVMMANVLLALGERSAALAASQRASQICDRRYGEGSVQAAYTAGFEARVNQELSLLPQAQALYERAINNYERRYGKDAPATIVPLYSLAQVLVSRGESAAALAAQEHAVRIVEEKYPEGSPAVVQAHWGMGIFLQHIGRFADARAAYERMLKSAGPGTRGAALALTGIADVMVAEKNIAGARSKYDEAIEVSKQFGEREFASSLLSKTAAYRGAKDYEEGSRLFEQALGLYENVHASDAEVAGTLTAAADFDFDHGKYEAARSKYDHAMSIYENSEGDESPRVIELLNREGDLLVEERKYEEALNPLGRVLSISERKYGANSTVLLTPLRSIVSALTSLNRFDEAKTYVQRSLKIVEDNDLGEELIATRALGMLASFHLEQGDYKAAQNAAGRALSIYEKHSGHTDLDDEVTVRNIFGYALILDGKFVAARDLIQQTMDISERGLGTQSPGFIWALTDMALLLGAQGDVDSVSRYIARIQSYSQSLAESDTQSAFFIMYLGGALAADRGKTTEARELFKKASDVAETEFGHDSLILAQVIGAEAAALADAGDYVGAEGLLTKAEEILKGSKEATFERAMPLVAKGNILRGRGKFREAGAAYEEAVRIFETYLGVQHYLTANALINLSWLYYLQGDAPHARDSFLMASSVVYRHVRDVLPTLSFAEQRLFLENEMPDLVSGLITTHEGHAGFRDAYELMFQLKGSLVDSLRRQTIINHLDPAGPYGKQVRRLQQVRAEIAGWYYKINAVPGDEWKRKNDDLTSEKEGLERELARALKPGELNDPLAGGLRGFQRLLRPDEVFVDLYIYDHRGSDDKTEERYAAVVTGPGGDPALIDLGPSARINKAIKEWRNEVLAEHDGEQEWRTLSALLWGPLSSALPPGASKVWISPDGELARIPWQLLPATGHDAGGLLVTQADSARELARLRQPGRVPAPPRAADILLVGDINYDAGLTPQSPRAEGGGFSRLENTRAEVKAVGDIGQRRKAEVSLLTGAEASKTRVIERLQKVAYAHLATHGFFARGTEEVAATLNVVVRQSSFDNMPRPNERNPLVESGIALAGANVRDPLTLDAEGLLTAEEIIGLDLGRCELVVLSACETGRGEEVTGQGVMGLRATVMAAGSRSMLISLWKVPDEATVIFMENFYDNLWVKKMSKAEALLRAQEAVRNYPSGKYHAPIYWAAWVLAGDSW
jgi:CHAT domain-containing protein/tetratricopeptide (TPR) repeat protein